MRRSIAALTFLAATAVVTACVTINVYFPAAQAEKAADRIINEVWGPEGRPPQGAEPQGSLAEPAVGGLPVNAVRLAAVHVLDLLIPRAAAQAPKDFDIETPQIRSLTASMGARHPQLRPFYESGAVGLTSDGLVDIRDRNLVPLADRNRVRQLVEAENRDRNALYTAIAQANGQPEWEDEIRQTFAQRWISKAGSGWYYRTSGGDWKQK